MFRSPTIRTSHASCLDKVSWTNGRRFGDVWLARWLWQLLELDKIVARHLPHNQETVAPADVIVIEVINQACVGRVAEYALAEHWYASTGLEDLLGVPDAEVTKDRLYRTLNPFQAAQEKIENDLKQRLRASSFNSITTCCFTI